MAKLDHAVPSTVVWVELATPDIKQARAFYSELLGWSYVGGDQAEMGFYTTAMRGDRKIAALYSHSAQMPGPTGWRIYFGTDDADETARKVSAAGGKVTLPPMDVMEHGRMALFEDPTGAQLGAWQAKQHQGAELVNEPGAMCWHEVYTRDATKAAAFYTRVFGLEPRRLESANVEYSTLHKGPTTVCGLMQMNAQFPKEVPSHWNTYFAVSDADASTARLQGLGGKVLQPPFSTPFGRMSAVVDPLGAGFCLIEPSPNA